MHPHQGSHSQSNGADCVLASDCPEGWSKWGGEVCLRAYSGEFTFLGAALVCSEHSMAAVHDSASNERVAQACEYAAGDKAYCWFGLYRAAATGAFTWHGTAHVGGRAPSPFASLTTGRLVAVSRLECRCLLCHRQLGDRLQRVEEGGASLSRLDAVWSTQAHSVSICVVVLCACSAVPEGRRRQELCSRQAER